MGGRRALWLALLAADVALAGAAGGREVRVPLELDHAFLREVLIAHHYTGPDRTAVPVDDGHGCQRLVLANPVFSAGEAGLLRLGNDADVVAGTWLGGRCWSAARWQGRIDLVLRPELDPALPIVHFRIVDSSAASRDGTRQLPEILWDWIKGAVHPHLATFAVDLASPLGELRDVLPLFLGAADTERARRLIDSIRLDSARATERGVEVGLRFEAGEAPTAPRRPPEPALTPEEIERLDDAWRELDAFLTYVIKVAGEDAKTEALRAALLEVLLESRQDLHAALVSTEPGGEDPVRPAFLRAWERLAPVLRDLSAGLPGEEALRYLAFVAAGDALRALDALGPELGFEISRDGLRRLARVVAPGAPGDPLEYSNEVDPELRRALGFGPPLPPPEPPPALEGETPALPADETPPVEGRDLPGPEPDAPTAEPQAKRGAGGTPLLARLLRALGPRPASAATLGPEAARLRRWVPTRSEIPEYLRLMQGVLDRAAQDTLAGSGLDAGFHPLYRTLVLATAWQESCWRQFVRTRDGVRPLRSRADAVGLMQVSEPVWRGFYDLRGLREDVAYNAQAGSEILMHYLRDFAVARGEHRRPGGTANLARASYAAYNGGPGHLRRYREPGTRRSLRRIDASFFEKYESVRSGDALAVRRCFAGAAS
jgi:hypothetical protein